MNAPETEPATSDRRLRRVFTVEAIVGFGVVMALTVARADQVVSVLSHASGNGWPLVLFFVGFSITLALLRFELTDRVFVSMVLVAFVAMLPLVGFVITAWIAVISAAVPRILNIVNLGSDALVAQKRREYLNAVRLFGTYGIPVSVAGGVYEVLGGDMPLTGMTPDAVIPVIVAAVTMIAGNELMMIPVMRAYGYPARQIAELIRVDSSIYLVALPFAVGMTILFAAVGWPALLALGFTGIVINLVAKKLAVARGQTRRQLQRLASLSEIGKAISLNFTTDQLLTVIYTECKKVVDVSLFSIALLDDTANELSFELDIRDDKIMPRDRIPVGEGLNSWVVQHREPLLIGSVKEEERMGLVHIEDGMVTQAWLGVPMISRDRVIGVISIQSYRKNVFTTDDVLLLTSIANQAAVALENANLYKDLEGLTWALEHRVQERTSELREMNLRLMAADRSKNQFLANTSHELRTPLNSIIGFSTVLYENTRELLPPRRHKFVENVRNSGLHLLQLINDILDLSKIEAGKMELHPVEFDIHDLLSSVERVMHGAAEEKHIPITIRVAPDVPRLTLDEGRLKQVVFNLLSNAVKFSPEGRPVTVNVSFLPAATSHLRCDSIRLEVIDRGIGMEQDELRKIFEEFYQTAEGQRSARSGTGLGLSLTRNFVELHHGTIDVESEPGEGSTFTVYLPVSYTEAPETFGVAAEFRRISPQASQH